MHNFFIRQVKPKIQLPDFSILKKRLLESLAGLSAVVLYIISTFYWLSPSPFPIPPSLDCTNGPLMAKYHANIKPTLTNPNEFIIMETITNPCPALKRDNNVTDIVYVLPERVVVSHSKGFMLNEVTFFPIQDTTGNINLSLPDGLLLKGPICVGECPESTLEILDIPRDSFFAAKNTQETKISTYIDVQSIQYTADHVDQGIAFAYIPKPFHYFRSVIRPFAGLSSFGQWLIVIIGLVVTFIITPVIQPIIIDFLQNSVRIPKKDTSTSPSSSGTPQQKRSKSKRNRQKKDF